MYIYTPYEQSRAHTSKQEIFSKVQSQHCKLWKVNRSLNLFHIYYYHKSRFIDCTPLIITVSNDTQEAAEIKDFPNLPTEIPPCESVSTTVIFKFLMYIIIYSLFYSALEKELKVPS